MNCWIKLSFTLLTLPLFNSTLLPRHSLYLSSPLGPSCVCVVSLSPEVSEVLEGTASFGFQDPWKILLFQPLAQPKPPYIPQNQSQTLFLNLTPLLPRSLNLILNLNLLLALKLPQFLVPSPDVAPGCPVQQGQAGPRWHWSVRSPGAAGSQEAWWRTPQSPRNPRSTETETQRSVGLATTTLFLVYY